MEIGKLAVNVRNTCLVSPSSSGSGQHSDRRMPLSAISNVIWFIPYRTRFLFFEPPAEDISFESLVQSMKDSLAKTLVEFYPVAGRLDLGEDGHFEVICNGEGVLFIEAWTDTTLEELRRNDLDGHFEGIPVELLQDLAQTGGYVLEYPWKNIPLFIVQVTKLSCNGVCLSIKFNHQILDGAGTWHLVQSWAETNSGRGMSLVPVVIDDVPECIAEPKHKEPPLELPFGFVRFRNSTLLSISSGTGLRPSDCTMKCFTFRRELISRLKEENPGYSTFQLLTAHLWSKVTLARGLGENETTGLMFAVNLRGRVKSVPPGYVGNVAVYPVGYTTAGTLLAADGVADGAAELKKRIGECTESWLEQMKMCTGRDGEYTVVMIYNVDVGDSIYFPVYQDFGFGKAVGMSILPVLEDGKVYYFPTRDGGAAAYISLKTDVMERFENVLGK